MTHYTLFNFSVALLVNISQLLEMQEFIDLVLEILYYSILFQAAFLAIKSSGGKLLVFQSGKPICFIFV